MPTTPPPRRERAVVVDERNVLRIWLDEKVSLHEITTVQADEEVRRYETQGKLWTGLARTWSAAARSSTS